MTAEGGAHREEKRVLKTYAPGSGAAFFCIKSAFFPLTGGDATTEVSSNGDRD